jgi:voltage-gated potassium channel
MDPVKLRFRIYFVVLLSVMVLGAIGFSHWEHVSFVDALYFSIVTVATVGYGDIHPTTAAGKLLVVLLIISGVGTFLGVIANATDMLLSRHEKKFRMQKLHILLGIFFSEVGTGLLARFTKFDPHVDRLGRNLLIDPEPTAKDFAAFSDILKAYDYDVDARRGDLEDLREFLGKNGNILLRLLESPYLLEHDSFTELLRAVFHLREELMSRDELDGLPQTDYQHLSNDIKRIYILLVRHWLEYMRYLKEFFPYLFSLAVRMNPFDSKASAVVK